jgi:hypothetical protein
MHCSTTATTFVNEICLQVNPRIYGYMGKIIFYFTDYVLRFLDLCGWMHCNSTTINFVMRFLLAYTGKNFF